MDLSSTQPLSVSKLSKVRRVQGKNLLVFESVSLSLVAGEFVALLGPSGCGKTTLLRIISGLEEADGGSICLGDTLARSADRLSLCGLMFQDDTVFPWLTVAENIAFGLFRSGVPRKLQARRVEDLVSLTGLKGFEGAFPKQLSGGMRQRVALARTLASDPKILLLDEPFGSLDSQTRLAMQQLLVDVWQVRKKTVLLVTHDVEEAVFLADKVYVATARPMTISSAVPVPLPRPRTVAVRSTQGFQEIKSIILEKVLGGKGRVGSREVGSC